LRSLDVLSLRALVATAQENHGPGSVMQIIDTVARSVVDTHFDDALADASGVARIALLQTANAGDDSCEGVGVREAA
jgi:hypothetical protein